MVIGRKSWFLVVSLSVSSLWQVGCIGGWSAHYFSDPEHEGRRQGFEFVVDGVSFQGHLFESTTRHRLLGVVWIRGHNPYQLGLFHEVGRGISVEAVTLEEAEGSVLFSSKDERGVLAKRWNPDANVRPVFTPNADSERLLKSTGRPVGWEYSRPVNIPRSCIEVRLRIRYREKDVTPVTAERSEFTLMLKRFHDAWIGTPGIGAMSLR